MIDVNKAVRTAFQTALDGKITYQGHSIPCYANENFNEAETLYILLGSQTGENVRNKGAFMRVGTIVIDVIRKSDSTSFDAVDDICSDVMNILQPTPQSHGLESPAGLQIVSVDYLSDIAIPDFEDQGKELHRALRYEYRITQL